MSTSEEFVVPDGMYPVVVEVDGIRTVAGWISGIEYLPPLLEALAAELRTLAHESAEVARGIARG